MRWRDKNMMDEKICAFCEFACPIYDADAMLCKKKGVVSKAYTCRKFSYDPLKHTPPRIMPAPELEYVDIDTI